MSLLKRFLALALLVLPRLVEATAGTLDCSFGTGGTVNLNVDSVEAAREIQRQSDGRLVTVGSAPGQIRLTRFTSAGALDASFAGTGTVLHNFTGTGEYAVMRVDSLDRIIVATTISNPDADVFVARFTAAG